MNIPATWAHKPKWKKTDKNVSIKNVTWKVESRALHSTAKNEEEKKKKKTIDDKICHFGLCHLAPVNYLATYRCRSEIVNYDGACKCRTAILTPTCDGFFIAKQLQTNAKTTLIIFVFIITRVDSLSLLLLLMLMLPNFLFNDTKMSV